MRNIELGSFYLICKVSLILMFYIIVMSNFIVGTGNSTPLVIIEGFKSEQIENGNGYVIKYYIWVQVKTVYITGYYYIFG